jgi:hypothetical protein
MRVRQNAYRAAVLTLVQLALGSDAFSMKVTPNVAKMASNPGPAGSEASIFSSFESFIKAQQAEIISCLEAEEGPQGARFRKDDWTRGESHGATCVLGK